MKTLKKSTCLVDLSTGLENFRNSRLLSKRGDTIRCGYGKCSACSCPGFSGSGYTCTRGGCGHHYDQH
jgi:hypothetical protein